MHFCLTPQIQRGDKRSQLAAVWLSCGIHCLALFVTLESPLPEDPGGLDRGAFRWGPRGFEVSLVTLFGAPGLPAS